MWFHIKGSDFSMFTVRTTMTKNNNPDQVACKVQGKRKMKWKSQLLNRFKALILYFVTWATAVCLLTWLHLTMTLPGRRKKLWQQADRTCNPKQKEKKTQKTKNEKTNKKYGGKKRCWGIKLYLRHNTLKWQGRRRKKLPCANHV